MSQTSDRHTFPMGKAYPEALHPEAEFKIGDRMLSLYTVQGRTPSAPYSLYWNDEQNPIQHEMTAWEVFKALESLLYPEE